MIAKYARCIIDWDYDMDEPELNETRRSHVVRVEALDYASELGDKKKEENGGDDMSQLGAMNYYRGFEIL